MTHPDDELSIAAWIRRLTAGGSEVHLSWTHSTSVRELEARAVAKKLAVPGHRLTFFDAPDGGVLEAVPGLLPRFADLIRAVRPDRIVCGAFEQGHVDHDATNYLVARSFDGPVYEVPFYHSYADWIQTVNRFADPDGEELLELDAAESIFKRELSEDYPSQRIRELMVWYGIWQRVRTRDADLLGTERVRLQVWRDYLSPNLPPARAGRVLRTREWGRWIRAICEFESG